MSFESWYTVAREMLDSGMNTYRQDCKAGCVYVEIGEGSPETGVRIRLSVKLMMTREESADLRKKLADAESLCEALGTLLEERDARRS